MAKLRSGVLRMCTICGLEARTENDLDLFCKRDASPHGRDNYCKACHNERARRYRRGL